MATAPTMAKSNFGRLADRYRDAYGVAAGTVRLGNLVKLGSLFLAGAVGIAAACVCRNNGLYESAINWLVLLSGVFVAVVTGAMGYIIGTFLAAQGQFMSAMLDTAINTSPHLQDSEKASIMML
jgi:hypothetical protein